MPSTIHPYYLGTNRKPGSGSELSKLGMNRVEQKWRHVHVHILQEGRGRAGEKGKAGREGERKKIQRCKREGEFILEGNINQEKNKLLCECLNG